MLNALLSERVKVVKVKDLTAAGLTVVQSSGVSLAGYNGVLFVVTVQAIAAGGVQSINAQQSDDDGSADAYNDLEGTKVDIADDDDNQVFFVDVFEPEKEYARLQLNRATANSAFGEVYAILYDPKEVPVDNNRTDEITGEAHVSPAEGTA